MGYAKKDSFLRKVWVQANDIEVGPPNMPVTEADEICAA